MADSVDTAASSPPADNADEVEDAQSVPPEAAREHDADHDGEPPPEPEESEDAQSLTELVEQLGRQLGELGVAEAQLEAARNMPEVRRATHDLVGSLVVVLAALTAFVFLNVAAEDGLSTVMATWLAAVVLAGAWLVVAGVLLFGFNRRARQWLSWLVLKAPPNEAVDELERERNTAGKAALGTLESLGPAIATQIALAAVPDAGDVASGVVEMGDSVLEASDEFVEVFTEQIPGGGVVNQVWDVALMPGRVGIKVATTVLRRGRTAESGGRPTDGRAGTSD
jgi:hypothetical protein